MGDVVDLDSYRRDSQYSREQKRSTATDTEPDIDESDLSYRIGVRLGRLFGRLERVYRRLIWWRE